MNKYFYYRHSLSFPVQERIRLVEFIWDSTLLAFLKPLENIGLRKRPSLMHAWRSCRGKPGSWLFMGSSEIAP